MSKTDDCAMGEMSKSGNIIRQEWLSAVIWQNFQQFLAQVGNHFSFLQYCHKVGYLYKPEM